MRAFTTDEIHTALGRLKNGLDRYVWLQRNLGLCDVSTDKHFQTCFNGFYRVRRGLSWRTDYFALMESVKVTGIDFPDALKEINRRTGRIEASFASKLVATLDPSQPVVDRFVLENFELKLPRWGLLDRESKTLEVYRGLCDVYRDFIEGPTGTMIRELFERRYPRSGVSELKKIDLVLWQIRP
jgi:hypothetical protein